MKPNAMYGKKSWMAYGKSKPEEEGGHMSKPGPQQAVRYLQAAEHHSKVLVKVVPRADQRL